MTLTMKTSACLLLAPLMIVSGYCCTFDTNLQGTWTSNAFDDIIFTSNTMTLGQHQFSINGQRSSTWTCNNDNSTHIILRSQLILLNGESVYAYICMSPTMVTADSYYFYMNSPTQNLLSNERIVIYTLADTPGNLVGSVCTERPSPAEFISIVRKGAEENALTNCPDPLQGKYTYIHTDTSGTTHCTTSLFLSVCPERKLLNFDYSACGSIIAYSASGRIGCVASIDGGSGTWYASFYNFDTTVNNLNTFHFSCAAIEDVSSGPIRISYTVKRCLSNQDYASRPSGGGLLTLTLDGYCCTFDTNLQGTWTSNAFDDITFTSNTMTLGQHQFSINGQRSSNWTCYHDNSTLKILRSNLFLLNGDNVYAYMCMSLTMVNANSYYFYMNSATLNLLSNERIVIYRPADAPGNIVGGVCTERPSSSEFISMIRKGAEEKALTNCPDPLQRNFTYIHTDSSGVEQCDSSSFLSVCPERQILNFDYKKCSSMVTYSASGSIGCVASIDGGSGTWYASLYNFDITVNNLNTFYFSCAAIEDVSSGDVQVSYTVKRCIQNQDFATRPIGGGLLSLTPNGICQCSFPDNLVARWKSSNYGTITITSSSLTLGEHTFNLAGQSSNTLYNIHACYLATNTFVVKSEIEFSSHGKTGHAYICFVFIQVTANSYYFYMNSLQDSIFNNERMNFWVTGESPNLQVCNGVSGNPSTAEFNSIVRLDSTGGVTAGITISCPTPLLGNFSYVLTSDLGTTTTCGESILNTCDDRQTISVDYSTCPTQALYTAGGRLGCISSIQDGSTHYAGLYNYDASPDKLTTFEFICIAVTSDGDVTLAASKKRCVARQTSTTSNLQRLVMKPYCDCQCPFPDTLIASWKSSNYGTITIRSCTLTLGEHTFNIRGQSSNTVYDVHACDIRTNTYVVKSQKQFSSHGEQGHAYICFVFTKVTINSYYFYMNSFQDSIFNNERMNFWSSTESPMLRVCNGIANNPSAAEFNSMLRLDSSGSVSSDITTNCVTPLLGNFSYVLTSDTGSVTNCDDSKLTTCDGRQTITMDYSFCSTTTLYSSMGKLGCISNIRDGSTYYAGLYNYDSSPDKLTTFQFICVAVTSDGEVTLTASKKRCLASQTSTTSNLQKLVLKASYTCQLTVENSSTSSQNGAAIGLGVSFGVLLLILLTIMIYFIYNRSKRRIKDKSVIYRQQAPISTAFTE